MNRLKQIGWVMMVIGIFVTLTMVGMYTFWHFVGAIIERFW